MQWGVVAPAASDPGTLVAVVGGTLGGLGLGYVLGRGYGTDVGHGPDDDRLPAVATAVALLCLLTLSAAVALPTGVTSLFRLFLVFIAEGFGLFLVAAVFLWLPDGSGGSVLSGSTRRSRSSRQPIDVAFAFVATAVIIGGTVTFGGGALVTGAAAGTPPWWGVAALTAVHLLGIVVGAAVRVRSDDAETTVEAVGILTVALFGFSLPTLTVATFAADLGTPHIQGYDSALVGALGWGTAAISFGLPVAFYGELVTTETTGTGEAEDLGTLLGVGAVVVAPVAAVPLGDLGAGHGLLALAAAIPSALVAGGTGYLRVRRRERRGAATRVEAAADRLAAYEGERSPEPAESILADAEAAVEGGSYSRARTRSEHVERAVTALESLDEFDRHAAALREANPVEGRTLDAVATADGRAYLPLADGSVAAVDPDGEPVWRSEPVEVEAPPRKAAAAAGSETVVAAVGGTIAGLDAASGERRWTVSGWPDTLAVTDDGLVCAGSDTGLAAADPATGTSEWSTELLDESVPEPELGSWRLVDTVAAGGTVWAALGARGMDDDQGLVVAVDAMDGDVRDGALFSGLPQLATDRGTLYAAGSEQLLIWSSAVPTNPPRLALGPDPGNGTPVLAAGDDVVALGDADGVLVADADALPRAARKSGRTVASVGSRVDGLADIEDLAVIDGTVWARDAAGGLHRCDDGISTAMGTDWPTGALAATDGTAVAVGPVAVGIDATGPQWLFPGLPGGDIVAAAETELEAGEVRRARNRVERAAEMTERTARWHAQVSVGCARRAVDRARERDQPAADLDAAVDRLDGAEAALSDGDYAVAIGAGEAARRAAEPRLEPLLDRARRRADEADAAFEAGRYDEAIETWEAAQEPYERARTLAAARDEERMAERLTESVDRLRENVGQAERQRANERMRALAAEAAEAVDGGDDRFEAGDYQAAHERFADAAETYREAAGIAAEHGFEDEERLREAAERARESVDDCKLAALADRLEAAETAVERADESADDARAARESFESVATDLSGLSVADSRADDRERLLDRAQRGIVDAGTAAGRAMMAEAERLYDAAERFEAKEQYDDARAYLREVSDLAIEYGLTAEREEVSKLLDTCIENAELLSDELASVGSVEAEIERADAVRTATTGPPASRDRGSISAPGTGSGGGIDDALRSALPEHELVEQLGSGGNADVHRVRLTDGREAALKIPRWQGTLSRRVVEEFTEEAETWAGVDDHEHIVDVLDYGTTPHPWLLLEYVAGGSLADRMADLSLAERLDVLVDACDAVHHAHRHGVAHADLKPENILLSDDQGAPRAKVADWGLARTLLDDTVTREGLTPTYAAPEQVAPESYDGVDDWTDCYQLGVIAFEVATGRPPFDHDGPSATVRAVLHDTPPVPSEVADADLPPELDEAIATATAAEKADRHETVVHLRDALAAARAALPGADAD